MKRGLLIITGDQIRKVFREALSPTFLIILLGAALLWYTSKLSNNYDTEIALNVRIDGQKYRFTAIVTGRGSAILARQLSLKRRRSFPLDELSPRPSRETLGALVIAPASLQTAYNGKNTDPDDPVIVEVLEMPEFIPAALEPEDGAASEKAKKTERK